MRSFKSPQQLQEMVSEIQKTSNECWAEFALHNEVGLSPLQQSSLVDVVIASKDQLRAINTLDRVVGLTQAQTHDLRAIAR